MNLLLNNWKLKLMSLVLAVALWSHVRGEVNPIETATFRARLEPNVPSNWALRAPTKLPTEVKVTVRAPRQNLREWKGPVPANPLTPADAPLLSPNQVKAHLDFSLARKGEMDLPVKVDSSLENAEIIGIQPANIVVVLEKTGVGS